VKSIGHCISDLTNQNKTEGTPARDINTDKRHEKASL